MGDQTTHDSSGARTFEQKVFARFDVLDLNVRDMESSIRNMEARLQRLERHPHDDRPIAEQVLKEIVETRRELTKRLDRIEALVYKTRSDLNDVEDRLDRIDPISTE
jgi:DNA-binding transcriptional MerR regulator